MFRLIAFALISAFALLAVLGSGSAPIMKRGATLQSHPAILAGTETLPGRDALPRPVVTSGVANVIYASAPALRGEAGITTD